MANSPPATSSTARQSANAHWKLNRSAALPTSGVQAAISAPIDNSNIESTVARWSEAMRRLM